MNWLLSFLGAHLAALTGIIYVLLKIGLRLLIHTMIREKNKIDNWPMFAWSGTDLALLSVTLSVTSHFPEQMNFDYNTTYGWYFISVICLILSYFLYGAFLKKRNRLRQKNPLFTWHLAKFLYPCLFFGISPLVYLFNNLF